VSYTVYLRSVFESVKKQLLLPYAAFT